MGRKNKVVQELIALLREVYYLMNTKKNKELHITKYKLYQYKRLYNRIQKLKNIRLYFLLQSPLVPKS